MIRHIQAGDIPAVCELYNWYVENSSATFETEAVAVEEYENRVRKITEKYPWLVLEEDGEILGFFYLSAFNERAAYRWVCDVTLYLRHDARGKGYGSKLMKAGIGLAVKDGYHQLVSIITDENAASIRLHEKFSFVRSVHFPHIGCKNGKWLGVYYYVLTLDDSDRTEEPCNLKYTETVSG